MRIAVDMMGGDHAPQEIIMGTLAAARTYLNHNFILVGKKEALGNYQLPNNVSHVAAEQVMAMDESVENLRQKRDSSIWVATKLVKDGEANAIISAGSTGAQMAAATLLLGRIKGIDRPAIALVLPTLKGGKLVLDAGANVEVKPEQYVQFARMGSLYMQKIYQIASPKVALLSNGTEPCKGTETVVAAHQLLEKEPIHFIGNLEGRDIPFGEYDVLVCDGFTGNVVLKLAEGLSKALFSQIKEEMSKTFLRKVGASLVLPGLKEIKKQFDYKEHGGAPLLGVKGISVVCHGSSDAYAIKNALKLAISCVEVGFIQDLADMNTVMPAEKTEN